VFDLPARGLPADTLLVEGGIEVAPDRTYG
jgi:hypothetical protein